MKRNRPYYLAISLFLIVTLLISSCKKDDDPAPDSPVSYVGTWVCNTNSVDSISFKIQGINGNPWVTSYFVYLEYVDLQYSFSQEYSLELSEGIVEVVSGEFSLEINNEENKTINCTFENDNFAVGNYNFIWGEFNYLHSQGSFTAQKQ